jgi:hypothetical protein
VAWVDGRRAVGVAEGVVAAGGAVRAFAGFATVGHAHIRGLAQDFCSSHVRCLKSSAPAPGGVGAQATDRGVVCASREARTASPAATGCSRGQRELVSLLRVVGVGMGTGAVIG